jgi:cyclophilin family peptidyl-prolyl cis-trans isomerase
MTAVEIVAATLLLLNPVRMYFQPDGAIEVKLDRAALSAEYEAEGKPLSLVLMSARQERRGRADVPQEGDTVDLMKLFPPRDGRPSPLWSGQVHYLQLHVGDEAVGSPLVVVPLNNPRMRGRSPDALRIFPDKVVEFTTTEGRILARLDHEAAPNHAMHFELLVERGFYTNIAFHRILPQFVVQVGDPTGTGTGGPGYQLELEPSDKRHDAGVLSAARSAGSQFFICLTRERCRHLDREYTAFGDVVEGMDVVGRIAATPLRDARTGTPTVAPRIESSRMVPAPARTARP